MIPVTEMLLGTSKLAFSIMVILSMFYFMFDIEMFVVKSKDSVT